jgi:hypothetical protein
LAASEQPADENKPEDKLPSLTIRNQSSFELTNVTFSGITFSASGSNDLPISGQLIKQLSKEIVWITQNTKGAALSRRKRRY